ncbi:MAG: DUF262 and DUF1524 domain-containing protein [Methanobacteriaceae archaeon]|nr:DUF262 and DUF1524 domain-containing protein [Methanobacteriaceae archaeon]
MEAKQDNLMSYLGQTQQLSIPIYQRKYNWTRTQCQQLLEDIIRVGEEDDSATHFIGSIVYMRKKTFPGELQKYMIIDGQQRITTITLLITAMCGFLKENNISPRFYNQLYNYYLINNLEQGNDKYKLILTEEDTHSLKQLIDHLEDNDLPIDDSLSSINDNYNYFKSKITKENIEVIYQGINKLIIIYVSLEAGRDNPQLIFESLNSTGLDLNQSDLIRNHILMELSIEEQEELYNKYWHPIEKKFNNNSKDIFDRFIKDYLTVKNNRIPKNREVYHEFKKFSKINYKNQNEELVKDINRYANYYSKLFINENELDEDIREPLTSLNDLTFDVTRPFILQVYEDFINEIISKDSLTEIIELIESYIIRRNICDIPTNSLNKTFATLHDNMNEVFNTVNVEINDEIYMDTFKTILILKDRYRRFPKDDEIIKELKYKDIYNLRTRNHILSKLENYNHKEIIDIEKCTIEHIMPQNENLSQKWIDDLGDNWRDIQREYLHTLGNLTLTNYNSELSDSSFLEKKTMKGGFCDSKIQLSKSLCKLDKWNQEQIEARTKDLSEKFINIWKYPEVDDGIIDNIKNLEEKKSTTYNISDFEFLKEDSLMRPLFDELNKIVLNINADVQRSVFKREISYKSTNNFLSIKPQKNALRIDLYIPLDIINDPRNMFEPLPEKWNIGNRLRGKIKTSADIDYVVDLIKQSYNYTNESEYSPISEEKE